MTAPDGQGLRPGSPYGGDPGVGTRPLSPDCPMTDPPSHLYWGYHCLHDMHLRVSYGLTCADYYRHLANQGGGCGGCGHKPKGKPEQKALAVDHDHDTNEIRGLLCDYCNRALNKGLARYLANPPARKLGPIFIPPDRVEALARRKVMQAAARKARPKKAKTRTNGKPDQTPPSNDHHAKVEAALAATKQGGSI